MISTQEPTGTREDRRRHGHLLLAFVLAEDIARQRLEGSSSAHLGLAQLDAVVGHVSLARRPNDRKVVILSDLERALLLNYLEGRRAYFRRPLEHLVK